MKNYNIINLILITPKQSFGAREHILFRSSGSKLVRYNAILSILFLLSFQGCGIFDTRSPENPATIRSTYVPPTTAEIVVDNLSYAILEKNSENYNKCLSTEQYTYVPDSKSQLNYHEIFQNWNTQSEKRYIENLISHTNISSSSVLFLDNRSYTLISSDSVSFTAQYIVVFQHEVSNVPKSAKGNVTLYLSTDQNQLFYISRWEDFRQNDTDFTWSELKANFSIE